MDTIKSELSLKDLRLRGRFHPANLVQGFLRIIGRARTTATESGSSATVNPPKEQATSDAVAQVRDALSQEARPYQSPVSSPTEPLQPPPQAPITH